MTYFYTYKITLLKGTLAGHYYYGQHKTSNLNDGYAGSGRIVVNYYKKCGKIEHQTYIKEIISFYNSSEELNAAEEELIGNLYDTDELCLNLRSGGDRPVYSEEYRRKLSEARKGEKNPNYGKHHSEETRRKIGESKKGKHHSEEAKQKMSESRKGKKHSPHSEETRRKMSEAAKRRTYSNEAKQKFSESHKGKHHSEETRRKMSESRRGKHWKFDTNTGKRIYY